MGQLHAKQSNIRISKILNEEGIIIFFAKIKLIAETRRATSLQYSFFLVVKRFNILQQNL
jgi:hypothetical protein